MDKVKGVAKGGWHPPGKDGKRESWRGDFKGINQVAGWIGKGKGSGSDTSQTHISRPLASLKDPTSFGPPPRKVPHATGLGSPEFVTADRSELGAPVDVDDTTGETADTSRQTGKPLPPPVPFRADRTGLSTNNLPKPPIRISGQDAALSPPGALVSQKPKPALPPRLPPRQNSGSGSSGPSSPSVQPSPLQHESPAQDYPNNAALSRFGGTVVNVPRSKVGGRREHDIPKEYTSVDYPNNAALSRLGAAGISVPGLGIGEQSQAPNPWKDERSSTINTTSNPASDPSRLSELQSRFSKMSTSSASPGSSSQGTTLAQKQAAFKTVSSFHNDPSSISFSDAKTAASTANNFRERHGDQVTAGWQDASGLNKKYGISNKIGNYASTAEPNVWADESTSSTAAEPVVSGSSSMTVKKGPPPPPPKKKTLEAVSDLSPPPIPLASKPGR